jgi:hypothetical protein
VGSPQSDVALLHDPDLLAVAYGSSRSIAELVAQVGVSYSTVRRALVRHGIARVFDDRRWLHERYRTESAVGNAAELGGQCGDPHCGASAGRDRSRQLATPVRARAFPTALL